MDCQSPSLLLGSGSPGFHEAPQAAEGFEHVGADFVVGDRESERFLDTSENGNHRHRVDLRDGTEQQCVVIEQLGQRLGTEDGFEDSSKR